MPTEAFPFLTGQTVEQIWVWGTFRLIFELGDDPEPRMYLDADDATYVTPEGETLQINCWADGELREAGVLLRLLRKRVVSASAREGVLLVTFDDGATLQAEPSEQYESWRVIGSGRVFQCLPGGEIGHW